MPKKTHIRRSATSTVLAAAMLDLTMTRSRPFEGSLRALCDSDPIRKAEWAAHSDGLRRAIGNKFYRLVNGRANAAGEAQIWCSNLVKRGPNETALYAILPATSK